jgi:DNA-binding response OmpR family regulator
MKGVSVLVCDDTAAKRYVIASWLRRDGYDVVEAETGAQALALVAERGVDLAVLDVHLPDMNGLEVCSRMKADPRTASTPVVHISAVAVETSDRSAGLDGGADAYLTDPIEPQEMLATVRSLLRSAGARRSAERLAVRLDRLAAASLRINVAMKPARLAATCAEGAARLLEGEAAVLLVEETEASTAARTAQDGSTTTWTLSAGEAAPLIPDSPHARPVQSSTGRWSTLLEGVDAEWWVVPVPGVAGPAGLIAVPASVADTDDDRMLLGRLAQTAAVALANLRIYEEEHRTALTLQRSLLPAGLPPLPGLAVAARYHASGDQVEIGGDFYDAFETDVGQGVVVIGDVQGHSLEAAIVMAELRYSLRAFMLDGMDAHAALDRLNRILLRSHPEMSATVCVLTFPPDRGTVTVDNAGHLPPLVVRADGAGYLEPGGVLLGVDGGVRRPATLTLAPGDRIVLMTDGLVERRGGSLTEALDALAEQVRSTSAGAEELSDLLMGRWGDSEDDICLIVLDLLPRVVLTAP